MRTWRLLSHELAHSLAHARDALSPGDRDGTLERTHGPTRSRATLSPLAALALVLQSALVATASRRARLARRRLSRGRSAASLVRGFLAATALRAPASAVSSLALGQRQGH